MAPESIIKEKIKETKADGYILKPCEMSDLDILIDILKSSKKT